MKAPFTVTIRGSVSNSTIPAKIISCCNDNNLSFVVPPALAN